MLISFPHLQLSEEHPLHILTSVSINRSLLMGPGRCSHNIELSRNNRRLELSMASTRGRGRHRLHRRETSRARAQPAAEPTLPEGQYRQRSPSSKSRLKELTIYCQVFSCMSFYQSILLTKFVNLPEKDLSWRLPSSSRIV